jgi:hypothetical protein
MVTIDKLTAASVQIPQKCIMEALIGSLKKNSADGLWTFYKLVCKKWPVPFPVVVDLSKQVLSKYLWLHAIDEQGVLFPETT